ncbi:MAG: hypothetical protein ACFCVG_11665 [Kineosporiaceae bacterium]
MSEKADALAYKADVPARTKDRVEDAKESVMSKVHAVTDRVTGKAHEAQDRLKDTAGEAQGVAGERADRAKQKARRAKGMAQDNPLGLAVGAVALGFIAGLVVPTSRVEDERLGAVGDQVRGRAKALGQEAVERGKEVAETAKDAAKDAAQSQAKDMTSSGGGQHAATGDPSTTDRPGTPSYSTP